MEINLNRVFWVLVMVGLGHGLSAQPVTGKARNPRWKLLIGADAKGIQLFSRQSTHLREEIVSHNQNSSFGTDPHYASYQDGAVVSPELHVDLRYWIHSPWFCSVGIGAGLWRFQEKLVWHYPAGNAFSADARAWTVADRTNMFQISLPLAIGWQSQKQHHLLQLQIIPRLMAGGFNHYSQVTDFASSPSTLDSESLLPVSSKPAFLRDSNGQLQYTGGMEYNGVSRAGLSVGMRYEFSLASLRIPLAFGVGVEYGLTSLKYQQSLNNTVYMWWGLPDQLLTTPTTYGCVNLGFRWQLWE